MKRAAPDASEVTARLAANLRTLREGAGLTKRALAARAETADSQVASSEKGATLPQADTLLKLAGALGVEVAELVRGIDWEPTVGNMTGHFVVWEPDAPDLDDDSTGVSAGP